MADKALTDGGKPYKYYNSLCKVTHLWRDSPDAIYEVWQKLFGLESAYKHAYTLPSQCIAGRWGSVYACEKKYDNMVADQLTAVLQYIITKKITQQPRYMMKRLQRMS